MKKLFTFLAAVMVAVSMMAEGHMKFKGVEIDGTPEEFVSKMKAKGFVYTGNQDGIETMVGDFATYKNCVLYLTSLENKMVKVSVIFPDEADTWSLLYNKYTTLKDLLTTKYGKPVIDKEEWQSYSRPRDDDSKLHELKMNRATIGARYELTEGSIEISLLSVQMQCCVILIYADAANQRSAIEKAMEDL